MRIGIKVYSKDHELIPEYAKHADFIEVLVEPGFDYRLLKKYGAEYVVHVPHNKFGFNPADKNSWELSKKILDFSKEAADYLNSKKMITHVGHFTNDGCNEENIIEFISANKDDRIILENLPKKTKYHSFPFATPEDIESISKKLGLGICLDFSHATCAAAVLKIDFIKLIGQINSLNPRHYHISDGWISSDTDIDLHFFKGNYPLEKFKAIIPKNGEVTIETYHEDISVKIKEIEFLRT